MSFPALKNSKEFSPYYENQQGFPQFSLRNGPSSGGANDGVMTYEGTIHRTILSFIVLLLGGAVGWVIPALLLPAVIVGLVLGLVIAFKRIRNPLATFSYSAIQGVVVGAFSMFMESFYPGIIMQAVMATLVVFVTVMVLAKRRIFRSSPRMNRIFMIAGIAYLAFALLNFVLMLTGLTPAGEMFGLRSGWFGIAAGILGTLLASYSLVLDVEFIENGVNNRIEKTWEWFAAFSLIGTLVWLYIEILRIIAIFRS